MKKPRAGRHVDSATSALARTNRPVVDAEHVAQHSARVAHGMDGLLNVIAGLGTSRDKRMATTYTRCVLTQFDLDNIYSSSWVAGRIVDMPAHDMVRAGWTRTWDGVDDDQSSVKLVSTAEKHICLKRAVHDALKWGRLYGGAAIIIGLRGEDLSLPLRPEAVRKGSLQYLHVLDRHRIFPTGRVDKVPGPHMGEPLSYRIAESSIEVHWSRAVRFGGRRMPYWVRQRSNWWDDSVLQRVVETVKNFDASEASAASLMYEASVDVHFMEGLAKILATDGGEAAISKRIETAQLSKSIWRTLVLDGGLNGQGGDKFEQKQINFQGVEKIIERLAASVAGAADIPVTLLFGESPGGLNANGDHSQQGYFARISAEQESELGPQLDILDEVLIRSTLGVMPKNYERTFNSLWQMDDKEQAEIEKLRAERDAIYLREGVVTENLVARQLYAVRTYTAMERSDVDLAGEPKDDLGEPDPNEPDPNDPGADGTGAGAPKKAKKTPAAAA